jgi:hypothetical protein
MYARAMTFHHQWYSFCVVAAFMALSVYCGWFAKRDSRFFLPLFLAVPLLGFSCVWLYGLSVENLTITDKKMTWVESSWLAKQTSRQLEFNQIAAVQCQSTRIGRQQRQTLAIENIDGSLTQIALVGILEAQAPAVHAAIYSSGRRYSCNHPSGTQ